MTDTNSGAGADHPDAATNNAHRQVTPDPCPRCGYPAPYPTALNVRRYPPTGRPDLWVRYGPDGPPGWGVQ